MNELVFERDGKVLVSSRKIAEVFGVKHDYICEILINRPIYMVDNDLFYIIKKDNYFEINFAIFRFLLHSMEFEENLELQEKIIIEFRKNHDPFEELVSDFFIIYKNDDFVGERNLFLLHWFNRCIDFIVKNKKEKLNFNNRDFIDIVNSMPRINHVEKQKYIYAFQDSLTKNIKIGISIHPNRRMNTLNNFCQGIPKLIGITEGTFKDESAIHKKFNHLRLNSEWFKPDKELLNYLKEKLNKLQE